MTNILEPYALHFCTFMCHFCLPGVDLCCVHDMILNINGISRFIHESSSIIPEDMLEQISLGIPFLEQMVSIVTRGLPDFFSTWTINNSSRIPLRIELVTYGVVYYVPLLKCTFAADSSIIKIPYKVVPIHKYLQLLEY